MLFGNYEQEVDRESDYEKLIHRTAEEQREKTATPLGPGRSVELESETVKFFGAMAKSAAHAIGSQIGRQIIRGVLGSILGGEKR